jgi:hypothetical protein
VERLKRRLEPWGSAIYRLQGNEDPQRIFPLLWNAASEFSLINWTVGVPSFAVHAAPGETSVSGVRTLGLRLGQKKLRKVVQSARTALDDFPAVRGLLGAAWWAEAWPGTIEHEPLPMLLLGEVARTEYQDLFQDLRTVFWAHDGGWEDLALFRASKLLYYVTTHEESGAVFGDPSFLGQLGLKGTIYQAEAEFGITGHRIPTEFLTEVAG